MWQKATIHKIMKFLCSLTNVAGVLHPDIYKDEGRG